MIKKLEYVCVFLTGGIIYNLLELVWRGYSHWSMTIAGGVCFALIHLVNYIALDRSVLFRSAVDCALITSVEFCVGIVVNLWLGLDVWDYSDLAGNIAGQICPLFTALWFFLAIPACLISEKIQRLFELIAEREENETKLQKAKETQLK